MQELFPKFKYSLVVRYSNTRHFILLLVFYPDKKHMSVKQYFM